MNKNKQAHNISSISAKIKLEPFADHETNDILEQTWYFKLVIQ